MTDTKIDNDCGVQEANTAFDDANRRLEEFKEANANVLMDFCGLKADVRNARKHLNKCLAAYYNQDHEGANLSGIEKITINGQEVYNRG